MNLRFKTLAVLLVMSFVVVACAGAAVPVAEPTQAPAATEAPAAIEAPAATKAPACTSDEQDIMCALESDPQFSTVVAILNTLQLAGGIKNGKLGTITFLVPTNDAFEAYFAEAGTSLEELSKPENYSVLLKSVQLGIFPGKQMEADLAKSGNWTVAGTAIQVAVIDGKLVIDRDINVLLADTELLDGNVIHVIDGVIIGKAPAATEATACESDDQDIMCALESDPQLSTVVAILNTLELAGGIKNGELGTITFLVPTNDAFEAYFAEAGTSLEELSKPENHSVLLKSIQFGLYPGKQMEADLAKSGNWTIAGTKIQVAVIDGKLVIDRDINVLLADIELLDGNVIHVIDGVIIGKE